jgi:ATP-binding cassette, subfamily B, bacterial
VKLLCGMYAPTEGRILLNGTDLAAIDLPAYRQRLTAGFQDYVRFELAIRESVGVGDLPRMDDVAAVRGALTKANAGFAERLPEGVETQLGLSWQGGVDLSGGEWQKLALARAMLRTDPLLMVLDEPTAALDPQTEHALFEQVAAGAREARSGRVTLLISHRFSTVRMADRIIVLDKGRVVEQGSHDDLVVRNGLYAELYHLQAKAYQPS